MTSVFSHISDSHLTAPSLLILLLYNTVTMPNQVDFLITKSNVT